LKKEEKGKKPGRLTIYARESLGELKKVTWPNKDEVVSSTIVVIFVVIVISLILSVFDIGISKLARMVLS